MTVQEPEELEDGEISDANIENYAAIVYKKDQLDPGLKKLGLEPLKRAIGYNQHKTDNLAILLGFPKDSGTEIGKYDYEGQVQIQEGDNTVLDKLACLRDYTGVPYTQQSPAPQSLKSQIEATNAIVGDGTGVTGTLTDNISDLWSEVGTGSGGGNNLTARVGDLETKVGSASTGSRSLTDVVGGSDIGSGNTITAIIGSADLGSGNTLTGMASALAATVDNPTTGVAALNGIVGNGAGLPAGTNLTGNVVKINQTLERMKGSVYVFKGNVNESNIASVIGTPSDWITWEGGEVWNVDLTGGTDTLTFNYPKPGSDPSDTMPYSFKQGANFAYVKPEGTNLYGTFDNLGSVADVTNLEGRVGKLESRFYNNEGSISPGQWNSDEPALNGMFLITAFKNIGGAPTTIAFMAQFGSGVLLTPNVMDLSQNFSTAFQLDTTTFKISNSVLLSSINVFKLSGVEEG